MTPVKSILNLGLAAQSLALVGENVKLVKKKKVKTKDIVKTGVTNIVGISLLRSQAGIIQSL